MGGAPRRSGAEPRGAPGYKRRARAVLLGDSTNTRSYLTIFAPDAQRARRKDPNLYPSLLFKILCTIYSIDLYLVLLILD